MITDWRSKFHKYTDGASDPVFPFGWAQLNSDGPSAGTYANPPEENATEYGPFGLFSPGFPSIRQAQEDTLFLPNTFEAVILDTPISSGSVHSPWKQPVGQRLARGGLAVSYGQTGLNTVHPVPESIAVEGGQIVITFKNLGTNGIQAKVGANGFEILVAGVWQSTPIVSGSGNKVTVNAPKNGEAIRYLWYNCPCGLEPYQCPLYTNVEPIGALSGERQNFLPIGPFSRPLQ